MKPTHLFVALVLIGSLVLSGCQVQKSEAQTTVEECITTGSFQGESLCGNDQCNDGISYLVGSACALKAAETIGKQDSTKGKAICDEWFKIDEEQFKDSIIMAKMPINNLVNCYFMSGNDQYRAEAMCASATGYAKESCLEMAKSAIKK